MSEPDDSNIIKLEQVRRAIEEATEVPGADGRAPSKPRKDGLPEDCPVIALGRHGEHYYYLDVSYQLRRLGATITRGSVFLVCLQADRIGSMRPGRAPTGRGMRSAGATIGQPRCLPTRARAAACGIPLNACAERARGPAPTAN